MKTSILSAAWWRAAGLRALHATIAVAVPCLGATVIADVPWVMALSAAAVGAILSLATSLFGPPETVGENLPWWLAALESTANTFASRSQAASRVPCA